MVQRFTKNLKSCELQFKVHSVQRIVAPVMVHANTGANPGVQCLSLRRRTGMQYFNACALFFLKFPQLKIQVKQLNMPNKYCINFLTMKATIFDTLQIC